MKKVYSVFAGLVLLCLHSAMAQVAIPKVVINEIYGGGGNAGSTYRNDFIELYNNDDTAVNLTGWSVQYASATGPVGTLTWAVTKLAGSIRPGGHYLIQQAVGTGGSVNLPSPDAVGNIAMGAGAGKVILCSDTAAKTGTRPTGPQIVDFAGYGTATTFEGGGPTPAPSASMSVQRNPEGFDSDQNATDFELVSPSPVNSTSAVDVSPPVINGLNPADNSTSVPANTVLSITFNEPVVAGNGFLKITDEDNVTSDLIDVLTPNVVVTGNIVTFYGVNLQPGKRYNVLIADSNFRDLSGNRYAGFVSAAEWNFSTDAAPPFLNAGVINQTYNLNTVQDVFGSNGFRQFSTLGGLTWAITTFGRNAANPPSANAPHGLQMNGYDNAIPSNVPNEDWLILPKVNLASTSYPLLSFWSRTRFNGDPLKLRISTDYPGYNNPRDYTWTDLNGSFPEQTSDVWKQSLNINLAPFKNDNVYIAFVYTSSDEEGARWALDDIRVDDSQNPPPPSLTVNASDIQFGFASAGNYPTRSFLIIGSNITSDISLAASAGFSLSADSLNFASSLTITQASANNTPQTIYVRFEPDQINQNYTGTVNISTQAVTATQVNLTGTTVDPVNTLEVVNWNLEWFGKTGAGFGPPNKVLQEQNVKTILKDIGADIFGLVEIVDTSRLGSVVREMPGYSYIVGNYGSHTDPPDPGGEPLSEVQKLAFVYKNSVFTNVTARPLINNQDVNSVSYNNWASGRYPFMLTADVTLGGITKTTRFVLLHAKANTAPTITSYNRRKSGADELHAILRDSFPNDNIVVFGDLNDDLDSTITDGIRPAITSYSSFINDAANFHPVTLTLSYAGKASTVQYTDMIDHVIVSNEMKDYYMNNTAAVLNSVTTLVSGYGTTTTDHYPVLTRFQFIENSPLPVTLVAFTGSKETNGIRLNWKTSGETGSREFIIEKSLNGRSFSSLDKVTASGNSSSQINYSYTDKDPYSGDNFYRLKLLDRNGSYEYSKVIRIAYGSSLTMSVSPNPAKGFVVVSLSGLDEPAMIQLLNLAGRVIRQAKVTRSEHQVVRFSLAGVSPGTYLVQVRVAGRAITKKILVE